MIKYKAPIAHLSDRIVWIGCTLPVWTFVLVLKYLVDFCVELVALVGKEVELVTLYIKLQFVNIS